MTRTNRRRSNAYLPTLGVGLVELERLRPRTLVLFAILGGLTFQLLLGTSYVGAFLDPAASATDSGGLPVAFVSLDEGARGRELLARLQGADGPIDWREVGTRDDALEGLEEKRYHGALVLSSNFSEALESFATRAPHAATVEVLSNPGVSTSGNVVAQRAIAAVLENVNASVRQAALAGSAQEAPLVGPAGVVTLEQARFLAEPLRVQQTVVNPVHPGGGLGLAPTYLAMAAWIGGYFGAVAFERFRPQTRLDGHRRGVLLAGAATFQAAAAVALLLVVGFAVADPLALFVVLAVGTWMSYALVSFLLDVFGLPGVIPAFAVLALGLPASGAIYPVEMLPEFYRTLHAMSPFTWLVEALRTALHATRAGDLGDNLAAMGFVGLVATGLSVVIGLWRARRAALAAEAAVPAQR